MDKDCETALDTLQRFGVEPGAREIAAVVAAIEDERAACAALCDTLRGVSASLGPAIRRRGGSLALFDAIDLDDAPGT